MTEIDREERAIYLVLVLVGAPVLIGAAVDGRIGGGATLCLLLVAAGFVGWVSRARRRAGLPRASALRSRSSSSR